MRTRTPSWPDRLPQEDILYYNHDQTDSSDDELLLEKHYEPGRSRSYRAAFEEYRNSVRISDWLKPMAALGGKVSRRTAGLFGILWVIVVIGWMASPRIVEKTSAALRPSQPEPSHPEPPKVNATASVIPNNRNSTVGWVKPEGFQVVGIVFYGRRVHVDILDCYLQQNFVSNGGYLDGVVFLQNTDDKEDIAYLQKLLEREPRYKMLDLGADVRDWKHMWERHFDENTMYFKLDDDLVYIDPDAIPQMVHTLLAHPEAHNVQANIVNSASTSWQHFHAGAVRPYLPEIGRPRPETVDHNSWRPSQLPLYPSEFARDKYDFEDGPPFTGHRWLPLVDTSVALMKTPVQQCENYAWGRDWTKWAIAAQHHYSLFSNLEDRTMDRYIFGNGDGVFNTQYERYKINMMAIWGRTINMMRPKKDDEMEFTEEIPRKLGMPVLVQTKAIAAHFSFEPQREIYHTDLLSRYRAYANEHVCAPNNQKSEFPDWQKTLEEWGVKDIEKEEREKKEKELKEKKEKEAKEKKEKEEKEKKEKEEQEKKEKEEQERKKKEKEEKEKEKEEQDKKQKEEQAKKQKEELEAKQKEVQEQQQQHQQQQQQQQQQEEEEQQTNDENEESEQNEEGEGSEGMEGVEGSE